MNTRSLWHAGLACLVSITSAVALAQASRTPPATAPANAGANAGSGGSTTPNSSDASRSGAKETDHIGGAKGPAYPASQPRSKLPQGIDRGNSSDGGSGSAGPGTGSSGRTSR